MSRDFTIAFVAAGLVLIGHTVGHILADELLNDHDPRPTVRLCFEGYDEDTNESTYGCIPGYPK